MTGSDVTPELQILGIDANLFPKEFVQLQHEIMHNHPQLADKLMQLSEDNVGLETIMGEIGAYCEIVLDGEYMPVELCNRFLKKLREATAIRILLIN